MLVEIGIHRFHIATNIFEYAFELKLVQKFDSVSTGSKDSDLPTQIAVVYINIICIQALPAYRARAFVALNWVIHHIQTNWTV